MYCGKFVNLSMFTCHLWSIIVCIQICYKVIVLWKFFLIWMSSKKSKRGKKIKILVRCNLQCLLIQFVRIKRVTNCANEKTQFAHMSERKDRFVRVCASIIHCAPRDWRSAAICIGESEYRTLVTHADAYMAPRCTVVCTICI
jgi:hypothetical protein